MLGSCIVYCCANEKDRQRLYKRYDYGDKFHWQQSSSDYCWQKFKINNLSVINQKGESQNGGNEKTKHAKFSEKRTFLTPWYAQKSALLHYYRRIAVNPTLFQVLNFWQILSNFGRNQKFSWYSHKQQLQNYHYDKSNAYFKYPETFEYTTSHDLLKVVAISYMR